MELARSAWGWGWGAEGDRGEQTEPKGRALGRTAPSTRRAFCPSCEGGNAARSAPGAETPGASGSLGKPRSGIRPTSRSLGVRGRRRAQFPQPGRPFPLRVYAGARQEPSVAGVERIPCAWAPGGGALSPAGVGRVDGGGTFCLRGGGGGGLRTATSLSKIPWPKWSPNRFLQAGRSWGGGE